MDFIQRNIVIIFQQLRISEEIKKIFFGDNKLLSGKFKIQNIKVTPKKKYYSNQFYTSI